MTATTQPVRGPDDPRRGPLTEFILSQHGMREQLLQQHVDDGSGTAGSAAAGPDRPLHLAMCSPSRCRSAPGGAVVTATNPVEEQPLVQMLVMMLPASKVLATCQGPDASGQRCAAGPINRPPATSRPYTLGELAEDALSIGRHE